MTFDPDSPFSETEMATASLALNTDLSVAALQDFTVAALKSRTKKARVDRGNINYALLQQAIVKTTNFCLAHHLDPTAVWVNYVSPGSPRLLQYGLRRDDSHRDFRCRCDYYAATSKQNSGHLVFAQLTAQEAEAPSVFYKVRGDIFGAASLIWASPQRVEPRSEQGNPFSETQPKDESFTYAIKPVDGYCVDTHREFQVTVKTGYSGKLTVEYTRWTDKDRGKVVWFNNFEAKGEPEDFLRIGELTHILRLISGHSGRPEAAVRVFERLGLKNTTNEAASTEQQSELKVVHA